ncbi:inositol monophosphatase family protein [Pseudoneobacillus sp. C159]
MDDFDVKKIGQFAKEMVMEAGELLIHLKKQPMVFDEKSDHADLVTFVDKEIEKFLVKSILETFPQHGIIGEEGTVDHDDSYFKTRWVIDPIDGTTNFIHNFPFYGISVGIVHKGIGMIGVVYNPVTDELFYAEKDNGAYVNDVRLNLNQPLELHEALVSTSMFWDDPIYKNNMHPSVLQIYQETRGLRMVGGAAISLCEIAKGTFNAYLAPALSTWDYAAGIIILKEAGGIITRLNGLPLSFEYGGSLLAAHPSIHQQLLRKFN